MIFIAHVADGLVRTSYLDLNAADSERHVMHLVVVWYLAAAMVVLGRLASQIPVEGLQHSNTIVTARIMRDLEAYR